ncbi:hypothetical protein DL239_19815 [Sedimentitalea sp. CY04]|uniref:Transmembrane protein n=1 Tax=Parasedimentitalea denitrificans TaxID=2211118 RepID=A0ABX0WC51_9RHOB|nr:hypothetical protein [Sedimentitalea sp. CY04]
MLAKRFLEGSFAVPYRRLELLSTVTYDFEAALNQLAPDERPQWDQAQLFISLRSSPATPEPIIIEIDGVRYRLSEKPTFVTDRRFYARVGDPRSFGSIVLELTLLGTSDIYLNLHGHHRELTLYTDWASPDFPKAPPPDSIHTGWWSTHAKWVLPDRASAPFVSRDPDQLAPPWPRKGTMQPVPGSENMLTLSGLAEPTTNPQLGSFPIKVDQGYDRDDQLFYLSDGLLGWTMAAVMLLVAVPGLLRRTTLPVLFGLGLLPAFCMSLAIYVIGWISIKIISVGVALVLTAALALVLQRHVSSTLHRSLIFLFSAMAMVVVLGRPLAEFRPSMMTWNIAEILWLAALIFLLAARIKADQQTSRS